MPRARKKKSWTTILAVSCLGICLAAAGTVFLFTREEPKPIKAAAAIPRNDNSGVGTVLVPDGQGSCHKYSYGNDSGKAAYLGLAPCDQTPPKTGRASLPPALRGMQENLNR
jgi:hypothetical protein